jgi:hypothetical protein
MGLAVDLPGCTYLHRPGYRPPLPASFHDHDLYPRPEPGRPLRPESGGPAIGGAAPPRSLSFPGLSRKSCSLTRSSPDCLVSHNRLIVKIYPDIPHRIVQKERLHYSQRLSDSFRQSNSC